MNDAQIDSVDAQWRSLVFPANYSNPPPQRRYHLCVIGAGPAGLVTAIAAAGLGARVALIERAAMGGDCLNVGCIPSKALLEFTKRHPGAAQFEAAFAWLKRVRADIAHHDSVERYTEAGVDVFLGEAAFRDKATVTVADTDINARRFVIATGARASLPPIPGLAAASPLTNENVFDLQARPDTLAIVGAGPIGCELALVFARLGTAVTLFEVADRVLPTEHPQAGRIVADSLHDAGVALSLGANIERIERAPPPAGRRGVTVALPQSSESFDEVLVAAGRTANTESLNVAAAGVQLTERGLIAVDSKLRTTNKHIFAAGDVCSSLQFTHHADAHARIVVQNALFFASGSTRQLIVPHCTYTQPEVAQVGASAPELERRRIAFDTWRIDFAELDRGRTQGDAVGFAEILTRRGSDAILGATIVGEDAGEQLAPVCLAMRERIGLGKLAGTMLPYPTRAEYLKRLADQFNRTRLTPTVGRIMKQWFRLTR